MIRTVCRLYGPDICGCEAASSMIGAVFQFGGILLSPCVDPPPGATRSFQPVWRLILDLQDQFRLLPNLQSQALYLTVSLF